MSQLYYVSVNNLHTIYELKAPCFHPVVNTLCISTPEFYHLAACPLMRFNHEGTHAGSHAKISVTVPITEHLLKRSKSTMREISGLLYPE